MVIHCVPETYYLSPIVGFQPFQKEGPFPPSNQNSRGPIWDPGNFETCSEMFIHHMTANWTIWWHKKVGIVTIVGFSTAPSTTERDAVFARGTPRFEKADR